MFDRLSSLQFIKQQENIIITGASGVGKSFLAQALGRKACQLGYSTAYHVTARLFNKMKLAKLDGTYIRELKKITNTTLLLLDDFGLQSMDNTAREVLMDIIDERHGKNSCIISSQIPVCPPFFSFIKSLKTHTQQCLQRIIDLIFAPFYFKTAQETVQKGFLRNAELHREDK